MNHPTFPEYRIQAFWGGRPEDERACALRLATMLHTLEDAPPALRRWYRLGMTRRASSIPLLPMLDGRLGLIDFMKAGRHYTDFGHHLMEDRGFTIAAWNGLAERDGMSFSASVGGATTAYRPPNFWDFSTSRFSDPSASVATAPVLRAALLAMAEAWDPLYGRVHRVGEPRRDSAAGVKPLRYESGWMVYLAPFLARHVTPPPGIAYETHPDGHLLMIATPDQFDPSNPAHQAAVEAIEAALAPIQSIAYY